MKKVTVAKPIVQIGYLWKSHSYLRILVYILVTALILYWQFIFGDKVFAFNDVASDTYCQYLKVYEFFSSAIKDGTLSSYTFQYGFGNSIFSMISWVSDPFSMIGVLTGVIFGQEYIADSMVYILVLKHLCAGALCLYFLNGFNFSLKSSMLSAYIYAFAGYIPTLGEHYFFANRPVYLLLLLIVLERVIKGEHKIRYWCGLLYVSALVTVSGDITAVYELFLAAGFYALYRVIYIYGKNIKMIFKRLGISLAFVLGGIGIASFILFPVLEKISESNRIVHSGGYFSFSDFSYIKSCIIRLFSNQLEGTSNSWYGSMVYYTNVFCCFFTVLLVPIAAQFVWRTFKDKFTVKNKVLRMIPIAVVVFFIINKFISYLFAFFVWHYHSYIYIFLPMYAVLFADVIDNVQNGKFSRQTNCLTMIISAAVIVWGGISTHNKGSTTSLMWMMFVLVMLVLGTVAIDILYLSSNESFGLLQQNKIKRTASTVLSAALALNLFCENYITTYYQRSIATKNVSRAPMFTSEVIDKINNYEGDNFFRFETNYYEGRMFGYTYPFMFPIRATAYYDSAINNRLPEFYSKMFASSSPTWFNNYQCSCDHVKNTVTEDVLGIKYLFLTSDPQRNGWEKIADYPEKEVALYENLGLGSAGLLFGSYISEEEADKMSFNERALGMAERLIIDTSSSNIEDFASEYSEEAKPESGAFYFDNSIIDIDGTMTYYSNINGKELSNNRYNFSAVFEDKNSNVTIPLNTDIVSDSNKAVQITYRLKNSAVLDNFVYFVPDESTWISIPNFKPEIDGNETVYTFVVPKNASHLALCVNQPCDLDFTVSAGYYENQVFQINGASAYNGTINGINVEDNKYYISANLEADDSNITIPLNTVAVNDRRNSVQITFMLNKSDIVNSFKYYDESGSWKDIPEVTPVMDGDETVYSFIVPQSATHLALCVNQACEFDVNVSTKIATATYVNQGIHLDNPKRGNIINGTVEAEMNGLLYLPVPYNEDWNAYIDGEKVEILKANYAFMAIPISVGEHRVDLIYSNKMYHTFLKVSIALFVMFNGFFVVYGIIRRKNRKREGKI